MTSIIQHKRSVIPGHVPTLSSGELAINEADGLLYFRKSGVVSSKELLEPKHLIAKVSFSAAASVTVSIDPAVIGIYQQFMLIVDGTVATDGATLRMRCGPSSGINSGSTDYKMSYMFFGSDWSDDTWSDDTGETQNYMPICDTVGNAAGEGFNIVCFLGSNDPSYDYYWKIRGTAAYIDNGSGRHENWVFAGLRASTTIDVTQFQFYPSSGNISGKYILYGVQ